MSRMKVNPLALSKNVSVFELPLGKGVCAASLQQNPLVEDVTKHANYIASGLRCSKEIVVPMVKMALKGALDTWILTK